MPKLTCPNCQASGKDEHHDEIIQWTGQKYNQYAVITAAATLFFAFMPDRFGLFVRAGRTRYCRGLICGMGHAQVLPKKSQRLSVLEMRDRL